MWFARLVHYAFTMYELGLLAYVIAGWILHPAAHRFRRKIGQWYEPLLVKIRSFVPLPRFGMAVVDISPVILFLGIALVRGLVLSLLVPPF